MTFYDRTKEDSRSWRSSHDTQAQAIDTAADAEATALQGEQANRAKQNGLLVTPATNSGASGGTVQLTATKLSDVGTVTWSSSDPSKATVDSSGLVTRVAAGTAVITASAPSGNHPNSPAVTGSSTITTT